MLRGRGESIDLAMPVLLDWGPSDYKSIGWRGGRQPGAIGAVKRMWGVTSIRHHFAILKGRRNRRYD